MSTIHTTAVVDPRVEMADDVQIGPYVVIEGKVKLGAGVVVGAHSIIRGQTQIGAACRIGPSAHVGLDPQHLQFDPSVETHLLIGAGTIIREGASVHRSTKPGIDHATRVGSDCFLMGYSHVAHDCQVGDRVILANGVLLGGHVEVGGRAFLGGGSVVHQFVKIGRLAVIGGNETVTRDVPPFAAVRYGGIKAYNAVGCRRAGIDRAGIVSIRKAFLCLHAKRTTPAAAEAIRSLEPQTTQIREILDFIAAATRGIQPSVRFLGQVRGSIEEEHHEEPQPVRNRHANLIQSS